MKEWIKSHRTLLLKELFKVINAKLRGHYQYYGVTDNTREVKNYLAQTKWLLYKWLNRRSQRRSYTLEQLQSICDEADTGSYYAAIAVTWDGDFILSMLGHESFGSEFVFELVKK